MLQFDEYKVKLNNLRPELDELDQALGLETAIREVEMLESESASDGFWDNLEKAQKVQQRVKQLRDKIEGQQKRKTQWDDLMTLCELGNEAEDETLVPEVEEGFAKLEAEIEEAKLSTLLTGEYDGSNAILTFHAGAGGTEAQDWAQMLFRMYTRWAERHGYVCKTLDYLDGDEAGSRAPPFPSRVRMPTATSRVSTACTGWSGSPPLTPTPGVRPPSPRWRSCRRFPTM